MERVVCREQLSCHERLQFSKKVRVLLMFSMTLVLQNGTVYKLKVVDEDTEGRTKYQIAEDMMVIMEKSTYINLELIDGRMIVLNSGALANSYLLIEEYGGIL